MKNPVRIYRILLFCLFTFGVIDTGSAQSQNSISNDDVLKAMKKASRFMVEKVSFNGGYLWKYAEDFSEREGEAPARETQIMVQGGTPMMGHLFLDIYETTGDRDYLEFAKKAANALIYGQHPSGGWHYIIDFDRQGIEEWYEEVACKFSCGMEEYRHYYGNCTYDDNTTQAATAYLLRVYKITLSPEYLQPLRKALDFMLISQYPNGGWPQRYPLRYEFAHDGLPDYTSMYTLNDDAMSETIDVLLDAYEFFGDERYLEAARRGGDFFMIAQGPEGQEGWAEQYDMDIQPCWARTHEPPGYMVRQTMNTISTLEKLYLYTGDRRYLRPIPGAIDWLEKSALRELDDGSLEMARLYEPGTNLPIKVDVLPETNEEGYLLYDFYAVDSETYLKSRAECSNSDNPVVRQVQGGRSTINLDPVKARYEIISKAEKEELDHLYQQYFEPVSRNLRTPEEQIISGIISSMNDEGAWIEDIDIWDYTPGQMTTGRKAIKGISVGSYIRNMNLLMNYIE